MGERMPLLRHRSDVSPPPRPSKATWTWLALSVVVLIIALLILGPAGPCTSFSDLLGDETRRSVLLLTAHPDDEAMFFSPTVLSLVGQEWDVWGLCLSTGNGAGLGHVRTQELFRAYEVLGVPENRVDIVDHPDLQDGMEAIWPLETTSRLLRAYLDEHNISLIITFDHAGVTSHPNHIALYETARSLSLDNLPSILVLRSPGTIPKFTGPLFAIYHILLSHLSPFLPIDTPRDSLILVSMPTQWITGWKAMLEHRSQLVWFRWLYLSFSRLMWVNELELLGGKQG